MQYIFQHQIKYQFKNKIDIDNKTDEFVTRKLLKTWEIKNNL